MKPEIYLKIKREKDSVFSSTDEFYRMLQCIQYGSLKAFGFQKNCYNCEFKAPCDEVVEVWTNYKT